MKISNLIQEINDTEACKKETNLGFFNTPLCDDTALNAIRLYCSDGKELSSAEGDFGTWGYAYQTFGSIVGIWMRGQDPSGPNCLGPWKWCDHRKGDDTAANGVRFLDSNGVMKKPGECLYIELKPITICTYIIHILQLIYCLLRYAFISVF